MGQLLFGTDGVRGIANEELTAELTYKLGQAGAYVLAGETKHVPRILVGMDTRISGHMLEASLVSGICSVGAKAVCLGVVPTPGVAYLTKLYKADAGIAISASHNPFQFNGIKFFNSKGYKLNDSIEEKIESIVLEKNYLFPRPTGGKIGIREEGSNAKWDYAAFLESMFEGSLDGIRIAIDCANGASYEIAPYLFERLGADVSVINNNPDGININDGCGSTHLKSISKFVKESGADIGLAFDGDADRLMAVDEKGNIVDGDRIMAIIAIELKKARKLKGDTIVATVMSNMGLDVMAKKEGINVAKTKVGDRYVLEEMMNSGFSFGGEQSGHIIFLEHSTTGDGILTALKLLMAMKNSGKKISDLARVMEVFPQVLKNAKVNNGEKHKYLQDVEISSMCRKLEKEFNGEGRVLIRPSGTEPLIRVMIEGKDLNYITRKATELVELIEVKFGGITA
jgi:phosphoglucosamine mutase